MHSLDSKILINSKKMFCKNISFKEHKEMIFLMMKKLIYKNSISILSFYHLEANILAYIISLD